MQNQPPSPSPQLFFETINAYQRTAALKAAVELEVFTAIAEGKTTSALITERCAASERGIRILCDYLTILGFLTKTDGVYGLTQDSAIFLNRHSPAYVGGAIEFMLAPMLTAGFNDLAENVRRGGTTLPDEGAIAPENPVWVRFARGMMPMMEMPSKVLPTLLDPATVPNHMKVLDIAAGHGLYGIAFAQAFPQAAVVALDWSNVLEVARENATQRGVTDRWQALPGSAFETDFGADYDVILLTNFLHHFDIPTCEALLRKVHTALKPGGCAITLEFVPNDDRISPPGPAAFSLTMLGSTPAGDAYTFAELRHMAEAAGFSRNELKPVPPMQSAVVSYKGQN
ncbi:MAG: methyltransferase domain-containing protein [Blastocatellia bacterium]|nr:methyltransferase domain-containing protein [Blastocatellia bacterium]